MCGSLPLIISRLFQLLPCHVVLLLAVPVLAAVTILSRWQNAVLLTLVVVFTLVIRSSLFFVLASFDVPTGFSGKGLGGTAGPFITILTLVAEIIRGTSAK